MHEEQAAAGSLVREHDIGPGGSVVVAVEADDVRVRGVDGTTVRLVAPTTDHPAIEVVAEPGRYAIRLGQPIRGRVFGFRFGSRGIFGLEVGGGTVDLEVPRDARLEISARSGDVSVRDVTGSVAVRTVKRRRLNPWWRRGSPHGGRVREPPGRGRGPDRGDRPDDQR